MRIRAAAMKAAPVIVLSALFTVDTPVVVTLFTTGAARVGDVALSDPSTQCTCSARPELLPGPARTAALYRGTAAGTVAHRLAFVCPEPCTPTCSSPSGTAGARCASADRSPDR